MCFLSRKCRSGLLHPKCQGIFHVVLGQEMHSPRTEQSPWISYLQALRGASASARLGWGVL